MVCKSILIPNCQNAVIWRKNMWVYNKMMNKYTQKSGKWVYQPNQTTPFRLSRTRIEMFLDCPRCFYLANRLGLGRPSMPGFSLNTAVDELLKKEFDLLRKS